jgi:hypothetical protein
MRWPAQVVASRRRTAAEWAYARGRISAASHAPVEPASWWGLCAALSTHYMKRGCLYPVATLWSELVPFLLMGSDLVAMVALEEYLVYKTDRKAADLAWLGSAVNAALAAVDTLDGRLVPLLESPERMTDSEWMAFLSYPTLLRVRRAVSLYDGLPPHPTRPSFWVGSPAEA